MAATKVNLTKISMQCLWPRPLSWTRIIPYHCRHYRIAGNFRGRKLSRISRFFRHPRKFSPWNSRHATPTMRPVLTFRESFLHEMLLSYRSTKVLSLENFPLYSNFHGWENFVTAISTTIIMKLAPHENYPLCSMSISILQTVPDHLICLDHLKQGADTLWKTTADRLLVTWLYTEM